MTSIQDRFPTSPAIGRISVLGAGSFGAAMAAAVARSGYAIDLYCRTAEQAEEIARTGENRRYFPGHRLSPLITATHDVDLALSASVVFLAFPARTIDDYAERLATVGGAPVIVNLVKGLHAEHFTFAQLFAARTPDAHYVALKGPTFAKPIFLGELSGLTCATTSALARTTVEALFARSMVDLDHCGSPEAVDAVSAIKNVYAVALGIGASLGLSENTIFMLVSRIIKEVHGILDDLGDTSALLTYSGLGDTLLTGFCDTSRNRTLGFMLGRGLHIDTTRSGFLAEGVRTISILRARIQRPLPILDAIVEILEHRAEPLSLVETLGAANLAASRGGTVQA